MNQMSKSSLHATCLEVEGAGVILFGASGSGKSDLALRLLDHGGSCDQGPAGAVLVGDDRVVVEAVGGRLRASSPPQIIGRLEVRGVGIVVVPYTERTELRFAVRLDSTAPVQRIPDFARQTIEIAGIAIPELHLNPFEASAPAKVRAMARALVWSAFANHIHMPAQD